MKYLLYPFALIYGGIARLRSMLYEWNVYKQIEFDLPLIVVGNLSTGGTGKTPHVAYLIELLQGEYALATLSRGYKRRTNGYLMADENSTAWEIGDEPMFFHYRYSGIRVAVGEDRALAIPEVLMDAPDTACIILDDAYQHRSVKAGCNILLTTYQKPFTEDHLLPMGRLREPVSAYERADIIVVTKCPTNLGEKDRQRLREAIQPLAHQQLFFSTIVYKAIYHLLDLTKELSLSSDMEVLLLSGIANQDRMLEYVSKQVKEVHTLKYADHYYYREQDLKKIKAKFSAISSAQKIILTTEKDGMRLLLHRDWLIENEVHIYCLPIEIAFLDNGNAFDGSVKRYLKQNVS